MELIKINGYNGLNNKHEINKEINKNMQLLRLKRKNQKVSQRLQLMILIPVNRAQFIQILTQERQMEEKNNGYFHNYKQT